MTKIKEVIEYLQSQGFTCVSYENSPVKIFIHEDGTIVKVEMKRQTG
jgi:hypothetical protein